MSLEFEFLPNLPKPNLDDRTFKDLVDECILRIPRYCPEWTNFNPGDPGITMVELFAWLTDQMLVRFNQVPQRNYIVFLEMLGIRLQPPAPAQTELTFYLTSALSHSYEIPAGTEVATIRTETEEAVVFSTDATLTIGQPEITRFLTAKTAETAPQVLRDRLTNIWTRHNDGSWSGRAQSVFEERPQVGNCFYLVFSSEQEIAGNVLAIKLEGEVATSTGINPDKPPRVWEAWNGFYWQPVLLRESDDGTRGFSFSDVAEPVSNTVAEADVIVHLPQDFPVTYFATYQGRWLRCVYAESNSTQSAYTFSPQLMGFSVRAIGGTINASQCTLICDEVLGNSDGTPGQTFQLQSTSILPRQTGEHLIVIPPAGLPEIWQEVNDFASSAPIDRHYTLDSQTGQIQFGPLIKEPAQMREHKQLRTMIQVIGNNAASVDSTLVQQMERQYGAIPTKGALIRMAAYRAGGGRKGNVQSGTVQIPKAAIPYIERVINHVAARNGADAESLEDAVMRVPRILRTRDRAVTPEDFETLTLQAGGGGVARVSCSRQNNNQRGVVDLLVVPQANTDGIYRAEGIHPTQFAINRNLESQILSYLDERRLLGVQVRLKEPEYVGVSIQAEVGLEPEYTNPQAQQAIIRSLKVALYKFLNPINGGINEQGWQFGACVYPSDIVNLFQQTKGVRYLGTILLFELRRDGDYWRRYDAPQNIIDPGANGLICSWADIQLRSSHAISVI
jgi:predicted phage baseplate assembly protein